jgi:hypothetical protein
MDELIHGRRSSTERAWAAPRASPARPAQTPEQALLAGTVEHLLTSRGSDRSTPATLQHALQSKTLGAGVGSFGAPSPGVARRLERTSDIAAAAAAIVSGGGLPR